MKIGQILKEIPGAALAVGVVGGVVYTLVGLGVGGIQNAFFHDIGDTIQVRGIELHYKGVEPYNPLIPLLWSDRSGYAEVRLSKYGKICFRYDDLTNPSLEGRIMVTDSEGKTLQYDKGTRYDKDIQEKIEKLKQTLGIFNLDGSSIRDIVEAKIQEAIAKR